jgi:hypothetical protein
MPGKNTSRGLKNTSLDRGKPFFSSHFIEMHSPEYLAARRKNEIKN